MKNKYFFTILGVFIIILFPSISAEEQFTKRCGGDEQWVVLCAGGDEQFGYDHNYIEEIQPSGGGGGGGKRPGEISFFEKYKTIIISLLICFFLFLIIFIICKKKKNKKCQKQNMESIPIQSYS